MNGFLNINKPLGLTSHDVVARVRRLVGRGVKVGHVGTLDPAATGVLPVALGQATRLVEYLADTRKGYRATVRLGISTTTDDAEGDVVESRPVPPLDAAQLAQALHPLRGSIAQVPPMYSALHHEGKRLYDLARAGEIVERPPREVTIYRLELVGALVDSALLVLDVECSKGTYIRALARDLGDALGCGAHLAGLERTFVGTLTLADAVDLATLQAEPSKINECLLPLEIAVSTWPAVNLDEQQAAYVRNGRGISLAAQPSERLRAHAPDGALLAVLQHAGNEWRPEKVFSSDERR